VPEVWRNDAQTRTRCEHAAQAEAAVDADCRFFVVEHEPKSQFESEASEIADAPRGPPERGGQKIVRLLRGGHCPKEIRVVTSDRGVADQVRSRIASIEPAENFRQELEVA
jgi:hypothetical protein